MPTPWLISPTLIWKGRTAMQLWNFQVKWKMNFNKCKRDVKEMQQMLCSIKCLWLKLPLVSADAENRCLRPSDLTCEFSDVSSFKHVISVMSAVWKNEQISYLRWFVLFSEWTNILAYMTIRRGTYICPCVYMYIYVYDDARRNLYKRCLLRYVLCGFARATVAINESIVEDVFV